MRLMSLNNTLGSMTTTLCGARIQAVAVDTGFVINTVTVSFATS
jgi:hypothetical protein